MRTIMVCALALSALSVACGKSRTSERLTRTEISAPLKFPKGFLWGTATAAEQLEATTASDWAELIRKSYAGEGKAVAGAAIKDLHLWPATVIAQKISQIDGVGSVSVITVGGGSCLVLCFLSDITFLSFRFSDTRRRKWQRRYPEQNTDRSAAACHVVHDSARSRWRD